METDKQLLEDAARAAGALDWEWWTSNSYRRLTFKRQGRGGRDGDALEAFKNPADGWPDVSMAPGVQEFIERASPAAVIGLMDRIQELEAALYVPEGDVDQQDWANTSPAVAWHLAFRHADNWAQTGQMMAQWARAWVAANPINDPYQTEGEKS